MEKNNSSDQKLDNSAIIEKPKRGRKKKEPDQIQPSLNKEQEDDSGPILAEMPAQVKQKRKPNEKTLNALKAGREKLNQKWDEQRREREEYAEKIAIKKANQIIRAKQNIKKQMAAEDLSSEDEQPIIQIQPVKPKKKQVVYLPPESDSEEEIIYKKAPKQRKDLVNHIQIPEVVNKPKINFF